MSEFHENKNLYKNKKFLNFGNIMSLKQVTEATKKHKSLTLQKMEDSTNLPIHYSLL